MWRHENDTVFFRFIEILPAFYSGYLINCLLNKTYIDYHFVFHVIDQFNSTISTSHRTFTRAQIQQ